jgi:hypothetical protein
MGLPKEELQFIDTYLENSGVDYIDVRLELTDHIATAIENELEKNNQLTFYEVFKTYMITHKKNLIENSELQKAKLRDKIIMSFLKSFMSLEVLLLIILSIILIKYFGFINYQEYFLKVNFGIFTVAILGYYIMFYKTRKTSIGASLLSVVAICYYIIIYIRNPLDLFFLIPVSLLVYKLYKTVKYKVDRKWSVTLVVLCGIMLIPFFLWFDNWSQQFVTDKITVAYFFLQLIMWIILFKTMRNYKLELDKKFKILFC